jgi:hypothetical protein
MEAARKEVERQRRVGRPFNLAGTEGACGVAIKQQTSKNCWRDGLATAWTIVGIDRTQVQLRDHVDDEACPMVRRQTFASRDGGIEGCFVIGGFEFSAHVPSVRCVSGGGQSVLSDRLLARNNADFQQLLQICGLTQTLIGDADAIDDLTPLNDRLMLGLQGTMSEAELFPMRARLQGGLRQKAARGERAPKLPIGFVYAPAGTVTLDPDQHVQEAIQLLFTTFRQVGSSIGVVRYCNQHGLKFPTRPMQGPHCGEGWWTALARALALRILHHPRYAGAFAYGRTRLSQSPRGGAS